MSRFSYVPPNETVWKGLRKHDITSTESAALFGLSPYMSKFELYHRKRRKDIGDIQMNDRMLWGQRMQTVIAQGIGEDNGVVVEPVPQYTRIVSSRMGASFDFKITGLMPDFFLPAFAFDTTLALTPRRTLLQQMFMEHGPGLFEIKATGYVEFRDNWIHHEDRTFEAPGHIEIQLQHQLHVEDSYKWGAIGVLVAGNTPKVTARLRDREVGDGLEAEILRFWDDLKNGREPSPTYPDDAPLVKLFNSKIADGVIFDGRQDPDFEALCRRYNKAAGLESMAKGIKETAAARIVERMKDAERAITGGFNVSRWTVAEAVVPTHTRKSFPGMRVTRKKAK